MVWLTTHAEKRGRIFVSVPILVLFLISGLPVAKGSSMKAINPEGANIPGISQAMIAEGGRILFLSGHVPMNSEGKIVGKTHEEQLEQVLANMNRTLKAAGTDFSSLIKVTLYVRDYDISRLDGIRKVRDKWINKDKPPTSSLVGVAALFHPEVLIEVEAVAVLRDQ